MYCHESHCLRAWLQQLLHNRLNSQYKPNTHITFMKPGKRNYLLPQTPLIQVPLTPVPLIQGVCKIVKVLVQWKGSILLGNISIQGVSPILKTTYLIVKAFWGYSHIFIFIILFWAVFRLFCFILHIYSMFCLKQCILGISCTYV